VTFCNSAGARQGGERSSDADEEGAQLLAKRVHEISADRYGPVFTDDVAGWGMILV
jgi:hypothetical protein